MSVVRHRVPPHDSRPCICRICTCGHHHCPGVAEMAPLNEISSYRDHYPGKQPNPNDRACPFHQPSQLMITKAAPGHFLTTKQAADEALRNAPHDRAQSYKPKAAPVATCPFGGNTTHREDYTPKEVPMPPRMKAPRENMQRTSHVPGAFETTNQAAANPILQALRDGTLQKATPVKNRDGTGIGKCPFDGNTCYREHYPGHQPELMTTPRRAGDRDNLLRNAPDNRDFLTTNGAAYQRPPQEIPHHCPASFVPRRPPSTDGHIKVNDVPDEYGHFHH